jgi:hypothetical protein
MNKSERAERIVRDMERLAPYTYEGLYGSFLRIYMDSDKSKWSEDISEYLSRTHHEWADVGQEIALILWEHFERRISC